MRLANDRFGGVRPRLARMSSATTVNREKNQWHGVNCSSSKVGYQYTCAASLLKARKTMAQTRS